MSNFDLSSLALASAFPTNKILTDDKRLPSVMVYIPKFKMSDVIDGAGDSTHPAFIVNGVEKDGIYISKYQNVAYNNRASSCAIFWRFHGNLIFSHGLYWPGREANPFGSMLRAQSRKIYAQPSGIEAERSGSRCSSWNWSEGCSSSCRTDPHSHRCSSCHHESGNAIRLTPQNFFIALRISYIRQ
jgi:hypothetical protein